MIGPGGGRGHGAGPVDDPQGVARIVLQDKGDLQTIGQGQVQGTGVVAQVTFALGHQELEDADVVIAAFLKRLDDVRSPPDHLSFHVLRGGNRARTDHDQEHGPIQISVQHG